MRQSSLLLCCWLRLPSLMAWAALIGIFCTLKPQAALATQPFQTASTTSNNQQAPSLETRLMEDTFALQTIVRGQHVDVMVMEGAAFRCMSFDRRSLYQSCMFKAQPNALALEYTRGLLAGMRLLRKPPQKLLLIGMGGGSIAKAVMHDYPEVQLDVVELDPAVVQVARDWFAFTPSAQVTVYEMDARVFVRQQLRKNAAYDLIMLDAFDHDYIPEHLLTVEFLQQVRQLLTTGGIVAANTFARGRLLPHEEATWQAVFPHLWRAQRLMNDILYAAIEPLVQSPQSDALQDQLTGPWQQYPASEVPRSAARPLTDQWSPTNILRTQP
ncbi:spermidine synthase [Lampropedia puyangensis]|nr:fused MFS/spermidine synthase [Lampropedia puyangensis]